MKNNYLIAVVAAAVSVGLVAMFACVAVVGYGKVKARAVASREQAEADKPYSIVVTDEKGAVVGKDVGTPIAVDEWKLWEEFGTSNRIASDAKYNGKYIRLTGSLSGISKLPNGSYRLGLCRQHDSFGNASSAITATIRKGEEPKFAKVEVGHRVVLVAKVIGKEGSSRSPDGYIVALEDARFVEPSR